MLKVVISLQTVDSQGNFKSGYSFLCYYRCCKKYCDAYTCKTQIKIRIKVKQTISASKIDIIHFFYLHLPVLVFVSTKLFTKCTQIDIIILIVMWKWLRIIMSFYFLSLIILWELGSWGEEFSIWFYVFLEKKQKKTFCIKRNTIQYSQFCYDVAVGCLCTTDNHDQYTWRFLLRASKIYQIKTNFIFSLT